MGVSGERYARVGVIGDVHCESERLALALDVLAPIADVVVQVGDIVDGQGDADETIGRLAGAGVLAIAGNHDRWFLANERRDKEGRTQAVTAAHREWLAQLPPTRRLGTLGGELLVCHGVGENDDICLFPDTRGFDLQAVMPDLRPLMADETLGFVVGGHTHMRMVRRFEGLTFLNAGTLHHTGPPGFVCLDFEARVMRAWDIEGERAVEVEALPL